MIVLGASASRIANSFLLDTSFRSASFQISHATWLNSPIVLCGGRYESRYDILLDTFFLEAPYGAWAENYVNKLLEKISQLGQEIKGNANTIPKKKKTEEFMKRIECLEKEVNKIGEELIRSSLLKKLHRYYYQIQSQKMQKNQEEETRREEIRYLKERLARLEQDD